MVARLAYSFKRANDFVFSSEKMSGAGSAAGCDNEHVTALAVEDEPDKNCPESPHGTSVSIVRLTRQVDDSMVALVHPSTREVVVEQLDRQYVVGNGIAGHANLDPFKNR
ncbi:MAG TPA: hypothetical protein VGV59_03420 [Pyrinomonadaceae bacterium]|nr:hypothetical protein [Pyrinomonadaceae bacterium]